MTYDDRERRDPSEPADPDQSAADQPPVDEPIDEPIDEPAHQAEPEPYQAAPIEAAPYDAATTEGGPSEAASAEVASDEGALDEPAWRRWSSDEPAARTEVPDETEAWETPTEGPPASAPWPTEPPAAGGPDAEGWPTTPPDRDEPMAPDAWSTRPPERGTEADHEPPPSEVEAYNAAPLEPGAEIAAGATPAHSVPDTESGMGESTLCPRCGTENRPGLAFCRNCGQRLSAAGVAPTVERPGAPEGTMACPRCGTHNRAGVAFCQNCGANLRAATPGYVPPVVAAPAADAAAAPTRRSAVLGPVVLLIGAMGLVTAYLLPFAYGSGSLFERATASGGYGVAFWNGYPDVTGGLADQAYFGFAAPVPILIALLVLLAIAGVVRASPRALQVIGLAVSLLWSLGLVVLFAVVEVLGNWDGDLVGLLRLLSPAGIIFFLSGLIVLIGTLTRFGRA